MKILETSWFVVFAVLALASVVGCSVEVLPSPDKDGGGTTDQNGDDVSPGDDANPGADDAGDDDSTLDEVNDIPTIPVNGDGTAQLGSNCEERPVTGLRPLFYYGVAGFNGVFHLVEMDLNGFTQPINFGPEEEDRLDEGAIVGTEFEMPLGVVQLTRGHVRLVNYSDREIKFTGLSVFPSRETIDGNTPASWDFGGPYPVVTPHHALILGELEKPEDGEFIFHPLCTVRLEDL